jgi:hypothetical protein
VESILGKLPVVTTDDTGTIPYSMRQHVEDFVGAAFNTGEGDFDGSRCVSLELPVVTRTSREKNNFGLPQREFYNNYEEISTHISK